MPLSSGPAPRRRMEGGGGARWGGGAFSHAADTQRGASNPVGSPVHRAFSPLARWRRRQQVPNALKSPHRVPNDPGDETPPRSDHSPRRQTQRSWIQARKRFRISISRRSGGPHHAAAQLLALEREGARRKCFFLQCIDWRGIVCVCVCECV